MQSSPNEALTDVTAPYIPTPAEIAAGCEEIQRTWDAREERSRRLWDVALRKVRLVEVLTEYVREVEGGNL